METSVALLSLNRSSNYCRKQIEYFKKWYSSHTYNKVFEVTEKIKVYFHELPFSPFFLPFAKEVKSRLNLKRRREKLHQNFRDT